MYNKISKEAHHFQLATVVLPLKLTWKEMAQLDRYL